MPPSFRPFDILYNGPLLKSPSSFCLKNGYVLWIVCMHIPDHRNSDDLVFCFRNRFCFLLFAWSSVFLFYSMGHASRSKISPWILFFVYGNPIYRRNKGSIPISFVAKMFVIISILWIFFCMFHTFICINQFFLNILHIFVYIIFNIKRTKIQRGKIWY